MNAYEKRNAIFGMEFDHHVPTHPSFAACIPRGAQIGLGIAPVSRDAEEGVERDGGSVVVEDWARWKVGSEAFCRLGELTLPTMNPERPNAILIAFGLTMCNPTSFWRRSRVSRFTTGGTRLVTRWISS